MNQSIGGQRERTSDTTGEVTAGLNTLSGRLGELHEHLRELESRIGGVLMPDPPSPTSTAGVGGAPMPPSSSSVSYSVRLLCEQLDAANVRLAHLTRRVDL